MKKILLKNAIALFALLVSSVLPALADTMNASDYIRITCNGKIEYNKPYIDFEYPDYDSKGIDDAFVNITICVCDEPIINNGMQLFMSVANIPRCHDEMTYDTWNDKGFVSILGTHQHPDKENLRIVEARYYPTVSVLGRISHLLVTGTWDIDDDGGDEDYIVSKSMAVSYEGFLPEEFSPDLLKIYRNPQDKLQLLIDYDATNLPDRYEKAGCRLKAKICTKPYLNIHTNFADCDLSFGKKEKGKVVPKKITPYDFEVYGMWSCYYALKIKNGSVGSHHDDVVDHIVEFNSSSLRHSIPSFWTYAFKGYSRLGGDVGLKIEVETLCDPCKNGVIFLSRKIKNDAVGSSLVFLEEFTDNVSEIVDSTANVFTHYDYLLKTCVRKDDGELQEVGTRTISYDPIAPVAGMGSGVYPFVMMEAHDFEAMSRWINSDTTPPRGAYFSLKNDIVVPDSMQWLSLGTSGNPFNGVFDGEGHTITFSLDSHQGDSCSVFGHLEGSVVNNLRLCGQVVSSGTTAGPFAITASRASFTNCESEVSLEARADGDCRYGGFVGEILVSESDFCKFTDCVFSGAIRTAAGHTGQGGGGYVGWAGGGFKSASFVRCLSLGTFEMSGADCLANSDADAKLSVEHSYYLDRNAGNQWSAQQLRYSDRGLSLSNIFDYLKYCFTENYPVLLKFHQDLPRVVLSDKVNYARYIVDSTIYPNVQHKGRYRFRQLYGWYYPYNADSGLGSFFTFLRYDTSRNEAIFLKNPEAKLLPPHSPAFFMPTKLVGITDTIYDFQELYKVPQSSDPSVRPDSTALYGSYVRSTLPVGAYLFDDTAKKFIRQDTCAVVLPHQVYLWLDPGLCAPREVSAAFVIADHAETGIERTGQENRPFDIYRLDGIRTSRPLKGVNIVNGKKIYVR